MSRFFDGFMAELSKAAQRAQEEIQDIVDAKPPGIRRPIPRKTTQTEITREKEEESRTSAA